MNRKLKMLGLVLIGVCAIVGMSASSASATVRWTFIDGHDFAEASQIGTDVLTVGAGTVKCNEATFAGTSAAVSTSELSLAPTYKECTAFGFVNATIDTNGCSYNLTVAATNALHINCPANPITITAFNCEVTLPSQTISGGITYHNSGSATTMDVLETEELSGITYIQHSKSFPGCSTAGTGTATSLFHNGTLSSQKTITATTTSHTHDSITVS